MAFSPGHNVGRVSIRVVPNTKNFSRELRRDLERIARTTSMKVRVDGVNVDQRAVKASIERQLAALRDVTLDANIKVTVDKAKLKKTALRKSIQAEFDKFENIAVNIEAAIKNKEHFQHEVKRMVDQASRNKVNIAAGVTTAIASARLRNLTRPRWVEIFVRINQASLTKAAATLAALSGARLAWKWIDNLADLARDLDKNLPSILGWTTGLTTLFAALSASVSGIVGIGNGLFQILPAALVLPGLLLNAVGSAIALFVALRKANEQLEPLGDHMRELGDIINAEFWGRARQPILDLVNGLMPQLRNSFRDLAAGVGDFTGALSDSFLRELSNGRLESIFKGIADGWRVLATGADAFAGAIVSLSQIAATYTPRLAAWFVRQADTFDNWLKAIATDGRLSRWMEDAIDSMYDLWDATKGVAGVFEGLWRAADAAGSGGLRGFADLMLTWEKTVKSASFQRALVAIFKGSGDAMKALGDGVQAVGQLIADQYAAVERFIASSGRFLGGLLEASANALNSPVVAQGLNDFSRGLTNALERIKPSLQPIADTFGNFLSLLGRLVETALPAAAEVLADLMPAIDIVIDGVEDILGDMSDALSEVSDILAPAIEDFARAVTPALRDAFQNLADALVAVTPFLGDLISAVGALVNFTAGSGNISQDFMTGKIPLYYEGMRDYFEELSEKGNLAATMLVDIGEQARLSGEVVQIFFGETFKNIRKFFEELPDNIRGFFVDAATWLVNEGPKIMEGLGNGITTAFLTIQDWFLERPGVIANYFADAAIWLIDGGQRVIDGMKNGIITKFIEITTWFINLPNEIRNYFVTAVSWLVNEGPKIIEGLKTGIVTKFVEVTTWFTNLPGQIQGFFSGAGDWLVSSGKAIIRGFIDGIDSMIGEVGAAVVRVVQRALGAFPNSPAKWGPLSGSGWRRLRMSGQAVGDQWSAGIEDSRRAVQAAMTKLVSLSPAERSRLATVLPTSTSDSGWSPADKEEFARIIGEYVAKGVIPGVVLGSRSAVARSSAPSVYGGAAR
ncbi:phage tail protein [Microbacterium sp. No. 7]|uniref:phage tail protein n=1 Tax=Microbacterium sp. No. 7 TaxID=1714373 RepID=UPI0006ED02F5|nr:hypothetical protein [Microbacterium sp. No. 7]ALJ22040.1 hypothetical protein AOA12_19950 [Microbacterium sp. No. 7]